MAESVLLTLSTKILSSIVSPVSKEAYEKGVSIWRARDDLAKLQETMNALRVVLLDAEKKEQDSDALNGWVQSLKGVFYDAEDLFDEIATKDLLKKQMREGINKLSLKKKVRFYCSSFNIIVLRNSIAERVTAIRERLDIISNQKNQFHFVCREPVINMTGEKKSERLFKYPKSVIGRDDDTEAILKMLIDDAHPVIVIKGIGGMGKTTLARHIYNHDKVEEIFEINRWFACIPDKSNGKEVLGKIYQSICERSYDDLSSIQLEEKIRDSINGKKYLLVLDDVWDSNPSEWDFRKSLLSNGAKGSKIIVTTRLQAVVEALGEVSTRSLEGLTEKDSWKLFKDLSFAPGCNEESRERLGKELLERCRGVPLAISCMGNLLRNKTVGEWKEIKKLSFPRLRGHSDETMSILKLSYDHLPSNLKQCFTYCCLFPKDYRYTKEELIYHWIAQGYINLDEEEHNFMELVRMGFFQDTVEDNFGEIVSCKMHDILHDLAMHLSGEESIMQNGTSLDVGRCTRHVSLTVGGEDGQLWDIPASLLNVKSIRTCMLSGLSSQHSQPNLDQLCSNFKLLRTLKLARMGIEHIPLSIGELKLVRHLDLSWNNFKELPDSITNLVNLLTLNLKRCVNLTAWPCNFKNFIKLRSLKIEETYKLLSMPEEIWEMKSLHYLSDLKVVERSDLDKYNELLERVRGSLSISFRSRMEVEDEWKLPAATSLQHLGISFYPGREIRGWDRTGSQMTLQRVQLSSCENVKYLPPMSCLPDLKVLHLEYFPELEFMEDEEEVTTHDPATPQKFFPCLKKLTLINMPKLKGWRRNVADEASSTSSTPGFPGGAFACLQELVVKRCHSLKILHLSSPHLLKIDIDKCDELISIKLAERPSILSESEIASN